MKKKSFRYCVENGLQGQGLGGVWVRVEVELVRSLWQ